MIRKPAADWGRESAAVGAVRSVASGGKAAVQTGKRMIEGGILCAIGAMMAFSGVMAGLFGSFPTLIGGGGIGTLLVYLGLRKLKGGAAKAPSAQDGPLAQANFGASALPSSTVSYSQGRLLVCAGFGVVVMVLCIAGYRHTGGMLRFVTTLLIPGCALMAIGAGRKAFGDLTALKWDAQGVTVTGLFKRRTATWSAVREVGVRQINTYMYGFVKVSSQRQLDIRLSEGPLFGKRMALSAGLLNLDGRTLEGLVLTLQAAQLGRAPPSVTSTRDVFDPAVSQPAFARAPQPRAEAPRPPAREPSFAASRPTAPSPVVAREAVSPAPPMRPAVYGGMPARTTFGRRGL